MKSRKLQTYIRCANKIFYVLLALLALLTAGAIAWADTAPIYLTSLTATPPLAAANTPSLIHLKGSPFSHSIVGPATPGKAPDGTGASWKITYELKGKYSEFATQGAVADGVAKGAAVFTVIGDGKQLYTSGVKHSGDDPGDVDIDTTGVQQLVLTVTVDGSGPFPNYVVWVDPQLAAATDTGGDNGGAAAGGDNGGASSGSNTGGGNGSAGNTQPAAPAPSQSQDSAPSQSAAPAPSQSQAPAAAPSSGALDPNTVLVVPFDGSFDNYPNASDKVTAAVIQQIGDDTGLTVIPLGEAKSTLAGINSGNAVTGYLNADQLQAAAQAAGARWVVTGSIDSYQVTDHNMVVVQGRRATVEFEGKLADATLVKPITRSKGKANTDVVSAGGAAGDDDAFILARSAKAASKQFDKSVAAILKPDGAASSK